MIEKFLERHAAAKSGQKRVVIAEMARFYGVSKDKAYAMLREAKSRRPSGLRKTRTDAGNSKYPRDLIEQVYSLQVALSQGSRTGKLIAAEWAIDEAVNQGVLAEAIPVGTYNRLLREYHFRAVQKKCTRFEARAANEMHQLDWTGSKNMGIDKNGHVVPSQLWNRKERAQYGQTLWVISVVDDYSRTHFFRYIEGKGENALDSLLFLESAWQNFFCYLPHKLYVDNGATRKNIGFQLVMEQLGVEMPGTAPHNSKARGKIESRMSLINRLDLYICNKLRVSKEKLTVEELNNVILHEWLVKWNAKPHPNGKMRKHSRANVFQRSIGEQMGLKPCPTGLGRCLIPYRTDVAVSRWGTVVVNNVEYVVPDALVGRKVDVYEQLFGGYAIRYHSKNKPVTFDLRKVYEPNAVGQFKGVKDTETEKVEKQVSKVSPILGGIGEPEPPDLPFPDIVEEDEGRRSAGVPEHIDFFVTTETEDESGKQKASPCSKGECLPQQEKTPEAVEITDFWG